MPTYTFKRNGDNTAFFTKDGLPVNMNGSNAIPTLLKNDGLQVTPTIAFLVEF